MYLYKNWIRFIVKEDHVSVNKSLAIHEIVKAMDNLRLSGAQIDSFIPMRFVITPRIVAPDYVGKDSYPYLNTVITKQKRYGVQAEKLAYPGSIAIYKEVYLFLNQFRWVYTYDTSYEEVVRKQIGILSENTTTGIKRMLLVPDCFDWLVTPTIITEELHLEDVEDASVAQPIEIHLGPEEVILEPVLEPTTEVVLQPLDEKPEGIFIDDLPEMEDLNVKQETDTGSCKIED